MSNLETGKISQIIGAVVDVSFPSEESLPKIYDALQIMKTDGQKLILECQQDIGENTMRCIAMESTDGLRRGMEVSSLGRTISMPTGEINGRLFNVVGDAIDGIGQIETDTYMSIHRDPPTFETLSTSQDVLYTGIKVIDLIEPYAKGGKI